MEEVQAIRTQIDEIRSTVQKLVQVSRHECAIARRSIFNIRQENIDIRGGRTLA